MCVLKVATFFGGLVLDLLFGKEEEFEYPHSTMPSALDKETYNHAD